MKELEPAVIFPGWANYGIRVELKPPNQYYKNPKLLLSEVAKDNSTKSGWKFYMRGFNALQKQRGYYNAHCTIPLESIPLLVSALIEIWDSIKPEGTSDIPEEARDMSHRAVFTEEQDALMRESKEMSELDDPKEPRQVIPGDPWKAAAKKVAGEDAGDENQAKSPDPEDFIPF